jgi:uncharacterized protein (TIGR03435 family)
MRTIVMLIVIASTVAAQTPVTFASVSLTRSSVRGVGSSYAPLPDGSVTAVGGALSIFISTAYSVTYLNIEGLPAWTRFITYDLTAISGLGRPATTQERESMMRAMLADRFKLVAHIEDRGQATPNLVPLPPTGDTRRVLVVDHLERPEEN